MASARELQQIAIDLDTVFKRFQVVDKYMAPTRQEFDKETDAFINHLVHLLEKRKESDLKWQSTLADIKKHSIPELDRLWRRQDKVWNIVAILFSHERYVPAIERHFHQLQSEVTEENGRPILDFFRQFLDVLYVFRNHLSLLQHHERAKRNIIERLEGEKLAFEDLGELFQTQKIYEQDLIALNEELAPVIKGMESKMKNMMRTMGRFRVFVRDQTSKALHSRVYELSVAGAFMTFLFLVKLLSLHGFLFGALAILLKVAHSVHAFEVFKKMGVSDKVVSSMKSLTKNMKKATTTPISQLMQPLLVAIAEEERKSAHMQPQLQPAA